ncbi:hypothetical protein [uncultured Limimaricola sp.]|uniref:tetratricopeptide repeat protein n=1 Tax=uncultured Limimaricola sp. TaxID=2211667 RepID=UPI0030F6B085
MIRATTMVLGLALAAPAWGRDCPAPPDHAEEIAGLLDRLAQAGDPLQAQRLMNALWELWLDAPDAEAQDLLDRAMDLREAGQGAEAMALLDQLIEDCPDYAEGWNQRAFIHYLQAAHEAALADLDAALARQPDHVGALSGRALALMGLGRDADARRALERALAHNPWLLERGLIEAPGTDI